MGCLRFATPGGSHEARSPSPRTEGRAGPAGPCSHSAALCPNPRNGCKKDAGSEVEGEVGVGPSLETIEHVFASKPF
jgi:hypothetical protein